MEIWRTRAPTSANEQTKLLMDALQGVIKMPAPRFGPVSSGDGLFNSALLTRLEAVEFSCNS